MALSHAGWAPANFDDNVFIPQHIVMCQI